MRPLLSSTAGGVAFALASAAVKVFSRSCRRLSSASNSLHEPVVHWIQQTHMSLTRSVKRPSQIGTAAIAQVERNGSECTVTLDTV